jgi:hypothetical protein
MNPAAPQWLFCAKKQWLFCAKRKRGEKNAPIKLAAPLILPWMPMKERLAYSTKHQHTDVRPRTEGVV